MISCHKLLPELTLRYLFLDLFLLNHADLNWDILCYHQHRWRFVSEGHISILSSSWDSRGWKNSSSSTEEREKSNFRGLQLAAKKSVIDLTSRSCFLGASPHRRHSEIFGPRIRGGMGREGKGRDGYVDGAVLLCMWRLFGSFCFVAKWSKEQREIFSWSPGFCLLKNVDELSSASEWFQEVV